MKEALGQNNLSRSLELDVDFVSNIEWLQQQTNRIVSSTLPFSYAKCLFSLTYMGEEIINMKDKETIQFFYVVPECILLTIVGFNYPYKTRQMH